MKELSNETRVLLAFLLSVLVMLVWSYVYKPPPVGPPPQPPVAPAPSPGVSATPAPPAPAATGAHADAQERTLVVENDLYRVEFSNRGAVVRSWQLKQYKDDHKPPRTLDVMHAESAQATGGWPLSLLLEDAQLEAQANSGLYEHTPSGTASCPGQGPEAGRGGVRPGGPGTTVYAAPAQLCFDWSDGHLGVSKRIQFDRSYIVEMNTWVTLDGKPLAHAVAWRGGFGDATVYNPAEQVDVFFRADGKLQTIDYKRLGQPEHREQRLRQVGTLDYAGIEDHYFAAAFLPRGARPDSLGTGLALWHWRLEREPTEREKKEKVPVAEMAAGSTVAGPLALRLFVGPKDLDVLGRLRPPMTELVNFGFFGVVAEPLFRLLKWIHRYVPNYGWAIVLMTVVINMILFPLKVKSWRSMQKMQRVAPEIKAIQDRYKKYSLRDPRRQQMNQEVMAVYKREGVNPAGGCLPMVLQMPVWLSLYQMLRVAIELRHATWVGWIRDLSAPDPFYILPVLMAVTMYWMQKMTPVTSPDPTQQQMMKFMPLMFGGMFVIFPISSGLVLYILTSNVVGMGQQWYLNRSALATPGGRK